MTYYGTMLFTRFDEKNLFNPHPATAGPRYLIAGPTNPFNKPNINYELVLSTICKTKKKNII